MRRPVADGGGPPTAGEGQDLLPFLHMMHRIRAFEETAGELYAAGKLHGTMHLSIGQEAVAVGAVVALQPDDYILSTHRGHHHSLAKDGDLGRMMAEFLGKETGYCRGRGGSMHIADVEAGNLGANGIVAAGIPISVGVGLSMKMQGLDRVCLCFFGDGAVAEGAFHEGLNMASIWELPVVYVIENNAYAMSMPVGRAFRKPGLAHWADGYGLPAATVDGMDVLAVNGAAHEAIERARAGGGPSLVECLTYRYKGHSRSDAQQYRTKEEVREWMERDPIRRLERLLLDKGLLTPEQAGRLESRARREVAEAVAFAEESPDPDPEGIWEGVYA